ncbi:MAG: hypothetical protein PUC47_00100, partial [Oscillospiraceae bacterium]|nr:hypothetical protein [Oscillospiraceae bacterium]
PAETLAQAIFDAKLGITSDADTTKFYYDPRTGTVSTKDADDSKAWLIEFEEVTTGSGGTAVTADGVSVTPLKSDGTARDEAAKKSINTLSAD